MNVLDKLTVILDDNTSRVTVVYGETDRVVLVFSSLLHVREEFLFDMVQDDTYIFIVDKQKSWGNGFNLPSLLEAITPLVKDKQIYCLGTSMGGYLAIIFANMLNAHSCLAFVPQYAIHPDVITLPDVYTPYINEISSYQFGNADLNDGTYFFIIFSTVEEDLLQINYFRKTLTPRTYLITMGYPVTHTIPGYLKDQGLLGDVLHSWIHAPEVLLQLLAV